MEKFSAQVPATLPRPRTGALRQVRARLAVIGFEVRVAPPNRRVGHAAYKFRLKSETLAGQVPRPGGLSNSRSGPDRPVEAPRKRCRNRIEEREAPLGIRHRRIQR